MVDCYKVPELFPSVTQGLNLDKLLECILTLAEVQDLKADVAAKCEGVVIETRSSQGEGKTATILVQKGVLKKGDFLLCGTAYTKV